MIYRGFQGHKQNGLYLLVDGMKKFNYEGIDKRGRAVSGSTDGENEQEVKAQLVQFGFKNIRVTEEAPPPKSTKQAERAKPAPASKPAQAEKPAPAGKTPAGSKSVSGAKPAPAGEPLPEDFVQKLIDGDIQIPEPAVEEETEEDEWYRAEAFARTRRYRYRQNVALIISLIVLGSIISYFVYDKLTEIPAPEPKIITKSQNELLSLKDVYIRGDDLVFVVYSRNWNGNVRVDFQAWDVFDTKIDSGTARLGFIGDHYGGSPQQSGTFKLKKSKFYERIELLVSGDEGK